MSVVPVEIRKHLIPFFYKEFDGKEAFFLNKKVKACKINDKSSLGFMLLTALQKTDAPVKPTKYYVFITIEDCTAEAKLYGVEKGKNAFLKVPEFMCDRINNILEDQFRIAFQYHINGMLKANPKLLVKDAIQDFMVEYEMDEMGFELESMRRLLNRGSKVKLSRLQSKVSNRVLNYKE